jgi:mRNA interferase RelE/StbE
MSLTYRLTLSSDAIKFVAKQERVVQERIRKALLGLTSDRLLVI